MEAPGKFFIEHPSRSDTFRLWDIADIHWGNRGVAKSHFRTDIQAIAEDPRSFALIGGDYGDFISPRDRRRFDARVIDPEVLAVCDLQNVGYAIAQSIRDEFKPIAPKLLGACLGNHEEKYMREHEQQDLHSWFCTELGISNFQYSALFDLVFIRNPRAKAIHLHRPGHLPRCLSKGLSRFTVRVFIHHGAGAAVTKSGKANRLERFAHLTDADITFVGHCHDATPMACNILTLSQDGFTIREKPRLVVMTGAYLTTYTQGQTGYGEVRAYPLATLGAAWVRIHPGTGSISSEVRT